MSEVDVKNTLEQMFREGFKQGFMAGRSATSNRPPEVRFEWRGRQPVITFDRPVSRGRGDLWTPGQN